MAEKEVTTVGGLNPDLPAANRPSAVEEVQGSTAQTVREAPEPTDEEGAKIYRVMYPTDQFVVEGHPVVNQTGVHLTAEQADAIIPAAEASGVRIAEVTE